MWYVNCDFFLIRERLMAWSMNDFPTPFWPVRTKKSGESSISNLFKPIKNNNRLHADDNDYELENSIKDSLLARFDIILGPLIHM